MKKKRRRTDDESVRRFLPLENGRRDVFGLVSLLLLLDDVVRGGGGFFRRFVAITTAPLLLRVARRCHRLSMKMDSMMMIWRKKK